MTAAILILPGRTAISAVALAARRFMRWSRLTRSARRSDHPRTVVFLRGPPWFATLRCGVLAAYRQAFPRGLPRPRQSDQNDPHFFDGVDLVISTSGSSAGKPRLVGPVDGCAHGLSEGDWALGGPGRWILALRRHHIAGDDSSCARPSRGTNPQVVDSERL